MKSPLYSKVNATGEEKKRNIARWTIYEKGGEYIENQKKTDWNDRVHCNHHRTCSYFLQNTGNDRRSGELSVRKLCDDPIPAAAGDRYRTGTDH